MNKIDKILYYTAKYYYIDVNTIKDSKNRLRHISQAKHVAVYLLRKHTILSFSAINKIFGWWHVSSAQHAYSKICKNISKYQQDIDNINVLIIKDLDN